MQILSFHSIFELMNVIGDDVEIFLWWFYISFALSKYNPRRKRQVPLVIHESRGTLAKGKTPWEYYTGTWLAWVQWVQLHQQIFRRTDFAPKDFKKGWILYPTFSQFPFKSHFTVSVLEHIWKSAPRVLKSNRCLCYIQVTRIISMFLVIKLGGL